MSSKAAASALFGLSADIKVKNIVLELVFAALPTVYMSKYKLLDPSDEMIVDILFQYVKSTLKERGEYAKITQGLVLEAFPNIDLASKNRNELVLFGEIAIKRQVYKAIQRIYDRIYLEQNNPATAQDPSMKKVRLLDSLFAPDSSGVKSYFSVAKLDKLGFLNSSGDRKVYKSTSQDKKEYSKHFKYFRSPSDAPQADVGFSNEGNTRYRGATYCFEPYIRVEAKELEDIILCSKELNVQNKAALANFYRQLGAMFNLFAGNKTTIFIAPNDDPFSETNLKDVIPTFAGKSFVCSVADLDRYYNKKLLPALQKEPYISEVYNTGNFLNTCLKSISLGVRLALDLTPPLGALSTPGGATIPNNPALNASTDEIKTQITTTFQINQIPDSAKTKGFAEKTVYYVEPIVNFNSKQNSWNSSFIQHFTAVIARSEQKYDPNKIFEVISEGKKWSKIDKNNIYGTYVLATSETVVIESLFAELLKKKEVDALVKSVLTPVLLYNTMSLIPNIEIGKEIIPIFRKSGAFRGIDEGINALISSLENYLSGDFPWLSNCSDVKELL